MAEYLVTGGAGFIGSHLVETLVAQGAKVAVLDNLTQGKYENIAHVANSIEFYEGSVCEEEILGKALQGVKVVFHLAAVCSVLQSISDPWLTHKTNSEGTLKLLLLSRQFGVKRVIYASSASIYGESEILPKVETLLPSPCSPYGASKVAGEYYCQVFTKIYGLETVALRYFNVFGPRQNKDSPYAAVIPKFILALQRGESPIIYGDGEQTRDFVYVSNVVSANLLAAKADDVAGKIFNIGCGVQISINQLLNFLTHILAKSSHGCHEAAKLGDIRHSLADITLARRYLHYAPVINIWEGLTRTISWFAQTDSTDAPYKGKQNGNTA